MLKLASFLTNNHYLHFLFEELAKPTVFLRRLDFDSTEEYAMYVRDRIALGMRVRCCLSFLKNNSKLRIGDIGIVVHLDRNGRLHELNVEVFS